VTYLLTLHSNEETLINFPLGTRRKKTSGFV
jgi:hypothetical protein